jgi:hypothetical protein
LHYELDRQTGYHDEEPLRLSAAPITAPITAP